MANKKEIVAKRKKAKRKGKNVNTRSR